MKYIFYLLATLIFLSASCVSNKPVHLKLQLGKKGLYRVFDGYGAKWVDEKEFRRVCIN